MAETSDRGPDRILLRGISARGHHGVLPQERRDGQRFVVDVTLEVAGLDRAAATDDLRATVDYSAVAEAVVAVVAGPPVDLLERLACLIAAQCLQFDGVDAVTVCVHKPEAPIAVEFGDVAVQISRSR